MEFTVLLKAYLEVGVLALIAIVMVTLFVFLVKKIVSVAESKDKITSDQISHLLTQMTNQNNELVKQLTSNNELYIDEIVHKITNHVPSEEENTKLTWITEQIDSTLQDIIIKLKASRVSLVQYHNGGKGVNKQSFLKMSMTNEQVQLGVKPFMCEFKDQFRSVLAYFIKELNEKNKCYIEDVETLKNIDTSMYEFMLNRNIQSEYGIAIMGSQNYVIAFISVEYETKTKEEIKKIDEVLSKEKETIQTLLNMKM